MQILFVVVVADHVAAVAGDRSTWKFTRFYYIIINAGAQAGT